MAHWSTFIPICSPKRCMKFSLVSTKHTNTGASFQKEHVFKQWFTYNGTSQKHGLKSKSQFSVPDSPTKEELIALCCWFFHVLHFWHHSNNQAWSFASLLKQTVLLKKKKKRKEKEILVVIVHLQSLLASFVSYSLNFSSLGLSGDSRKITLSW